MSPSLPVNVPPPTAPARHPGPRPRCEPLTTFIMKALACGYVECHPSGHPHVTLAAPTFMMKPPDLHHESPELGFRRHPLHPSVTDQAVEDLAVMAEPTTTMLRNLPCRSQKHASARFRPIAWQTPNSLPAGPYVTPAHTRKIASASQERTSDVGVDGYTDATGLIYLINRYYDPVTGQFISVDPLVQRTGQPYQFVNSDPVNGSDPLGLGFWGDVAAVAIGVVVVVATVACVIAEPCGIAEAIAAGTAAVTTTATVAEDDPALLENGSSGAQAVESGIGDSSALDTNAAGDCPAGVNADSQAAAEEESQYATQHIGDEPGRPSFDEILQTRSSADPYNLGNGRTGYWSNGIQVIVNNGNLARSTAFYRSTPLASG